jgi:hypothetical protein
MSGSLIITLEARCAILRAQAISVGKELESSKVEGKTLRIIRGLEIAHRAAWLRFYEADNALHTIRGC